MRAIFFSGVVIRQRVFNITKQIFFPVLSIKRSLQMEERCVQVGLRGAIVAKMDEQVRNAISRYPSNIQFQTLRGSLLLPEEMFAKIWADIARKP